MFETLGLLPNIGIIIASLAVLVFGSEKLIKSLIALAKKYNFSSILIGITIVAVGTSLPEIGAHVVASFNILSHPNDLELYRVLSSAVLGGNIGSDVVQQTLIIGIVVIAMGGLTFKKKFLKKAYLPMIGGAVLTLALSIDGTLSRLDGLISLTCFAVYMFYLWKTKTSEIYDGTEIEKSQNERKDVVIVLLSMALILVSAHFALTSTHNIVKLTGLGSSLIGVVSLGVASALPEMLTAISGLKHKVAGISLGTLIGSNITNPLLGIGLGSLISTYFVSKPIYMWDLPMRIVTAVILLIYIIYKKGELSRIGGFYLIGMYAFYLIIRILYFAVD
ncbi:MAG: hypothetical protein R6U26_04290 [Candidatus Undinarchaeales archaeon]